ncbi:MAG: efflux RND transporter periplasmic adaptor subunit, partial [Reichenbachiella sp.]
TKKKEVDELKGQVKDIKAQIVDLETEIKDVDPSYGVKSVNAEIITVLEVSPQFFEHKIEVRGGVESRTNVTVGPEIMGKVLKIHVKEGQKVKLGQTLITLDDIIIRNNIAELETSLELATIVAGKQENLWKQNIGTEIQYLEAKNNQKSLERKLATTRSQLRQSKIRAPFSGSIDAVDAKIGEMVSPGQQMLRIVNTEDVHVGSDVSERFIGKFKAGDAVKVYFPSQDKTILSSVSAVGNVINPENRTFEMEVSLPRKLDFPVKPNQVVVLSITDYKNDEAISVPTRLIQKDNKGTFVYEIVEKEGRKVAQKNHVKAGRSYDNQTEVLEGLKIGQVLADKGYRDLAQGVIVDIQAAK